MRTRPSFPLVFAVLAALLPRPAAAWLPEGHLATGAIAFDVLEQHDPPVLAAILRLMPAHPERDRLDRELAGLSGRARDRRVLEWMAIWPDLARGGPFDHDDWHYSQAFASAFRRVVPWSFGGAEDAFRRNLATARDPGADAAARAVALCWVLHIVGDMHQPLHAAVWISWRFPISDAGGNWAWVRPAADADPVSLHWFWDSAARPGALSRASPDEFVAQLEREHPYRVERAFPRPEEAFAAWVAHSRALARDAAYERGALPVGVRPSDAPVLRPDYVERVRTVGAAQIAAAGNRIADLLVGLR